jgi:DNA-binding beta-propeller fold protein YncE
MHRFEPKSVINTGYVFWRQFLGPVLLELAVFLVTLGPTAVRQGLPALELGSRVILPAVNGRRLDDLGVDVKGQRLFVTAFYNHTVEVIDQRLGERARTLSDLRNPQGVFYQYSTNRLYLSSSIDGSVKIFDGTTFEMLSTVKFSSDADNLHYDALSNSVVVGYGGEKFLHGKPVRGHGVGALAFLDPSGKNRGEIALDAHPESFQLEKAGTRVFVNVPDHREIEVADVVTRKILSRGPVTSCTDNFPMSLDEAHHRLFVGSRTPSSLLVFDTERGKMIAAYPTVEHSDDLFYTHREEEFTVSA